MLTILPKVIYETEKVFLEFFVSSFVKKTFEFFKNKTKSRLGWAGLRTNRLTTKVTITWLNDEFSPT